MNIATLYRRDRFDHFRPIDASRKWWLEISKSLATLGHKVDMIVNTNRHGNRISPNFRQVPYDMTDFAKYDVLMTFLHAGFESLCYEGVDCHPFIISNLGSVVGRTDSEEGVYFFGDRRRRLFDLQAKMARTSKFINILTEPSKKLWEKEFGDAKNILLIPGAADKEVPPPGRDPYQEFGGKIAVYMGNIYSDTQREVNLLWQERLNTLGRYLKDKDIRLCFIGPGKTDVLDTDAVLNLGIVDDIWDYQYFANVGIVLAQGQVQHNESTKIYYYLRSGLPVVSETPVPNNYVIRDANLGMISNYGDFEMMANMVEAVAKRSWNKKKAAQYIVDHHTWDKRAESLDIVIRDNAPSFSKVRSRWWGYSVNRRKWTFRAKRRARGFFSKVSRRWQQS